MEKLEQFVVIVGAVASSAAVRVGVAVSTIATWAAGWLSPAAALVSIAWISFQFYHSEPMKERRRRRDALKEQS